MTNSSSGVVLECESKGWYPEPELFWLDAEGKLLSAGAPETVRGSDGLYTVSSRVTVEKRHSNSFTCRVQQLSINQSIDTHIHVPDFFFVYIYDRSALYVAIVFAVIFVFMSILAVVFVLCKRRQNKIKRTELRDLKERHEEQLEAERAEKRELAVENAKLEEELQKKENEQRHQREECEKLKEEQRKMTEQHRKQLEEREENKRRLRETAEREKVEEEASMRDTVRVREQLNKENRLLKAELDKLKLQQRKLDEHTKQLRKQLEEVETQRDENEKRLRETAQREKEEKMRETERVREKLSKENKLLKAEFDKLKEDQTKLKNQTEQNSELRQQLEEAKRQRDENKRRLQETVKQKEGVEINEINEFVRKTKAELAKQQQTEHTSSELVESKHFNTQIQILKQIQMLVSEFERKMTLKNPTQPTDVACSFSDDSQKHLTSSLQSDHGKQQHNPTNQLPLMNYSSGSGDGDTGRLQGTELGNRNKETVASSHTPPYSIASQQQHNKHNKRTSPAGAAAADLHSSQSYKSTGRVTKDLPGEQRHKRVAAGQKEGDTHTDSLSKAQGGPKESIKPPDQKQNTKNETYKPTARQQIQKDNNKPPVGRTNQGHKESRGTRDQKNSVCDLHKETTQEKSNVEKPQTQSSSCVVT